MNFRRSSAHVHVAALLAAFALAVPGAPTGAAAQARAAWDNRGWELLGERSVEGRRDRDTIEIGRREGRFGSLTLVVEDSDLELRSLVVHFGDGSTFAPELRHVFREGTRARAISRVELSYGNLPGGGRATVQIWGRQANPGPTPGSDGAWDPAGWVLVGERIVQGRRDRDTIRPRRRGSFQRLAFVVQDSDLELFDVRVTFANGRRFSPEVRAVFRENTRSRVVDLPGDSRSIRRIDFRYGNLPRGGRARLQVFAR